jgi:hypothetical protein
VEASIDVHPSILEAMLPSILIIIGLGFLTVFFTHPIGGDYYGKTNNVATAVPTNTPVTSGTVGGGGEV